MRRSRKDDLSNRLAQGQTTGEVRFTGPITFVERANDKPDQIGDNPSEGEYLKKPDLPLSEEEKEILLSLYVAERTKSRANLLRERLNRVWPPVRYQGSSGGLESRLSATAKNEPPGRAIAIMDFLLPHGNRESLIGDLEEEYRTRILPRYGRKVADSWCWWQAIRSVVSVVWERFRLWIGAGFLLKAFDWLMQRFGS